jgi:hypothetical protein
MQSCLHKRFFSDPNSSFIKPINKLLSNIFIATRVRERVSSRCDIQYINRIIDTKLTISILIKHEIMTLTYSSLFVFLILFAYNGNIMAGNQSIFDLHFSDLKLLSNKSQLNNSLNLSSIPQSRGERGEFGLYF